MWRVCAVVGEGHTCKNGEHLQLRKNALIIMLRPYRTITSTQTQLLENSDKKSPPNNNEMNQKLSSSAGETERGGDLQTNSGMLFNEKGDDVSEKDKIAEEESIEKSHESEQRGVGTCEDMPPELMQPQQKKSSQQIEYEKYQHETYQQRLQQKSTSQSAIVSHDAKPKEHQRGACMPCTTDTADGNEMNQRLSRSAGETERCHDLQVQTDSAPCDDTEAKSKQMREHFCNKTGDDVSDEEEIAEEERIEKSHESEPRGARTCEKKTNRSKDVPAEQPQQQHEQNYPISRGDEQCQQSQKQRQQKSARESAFNSQGAKPKGPKSRPTYRSRHQLEQTSPVGSGASVASSASRASDVSDDEVKLIRPVTDVGEKRSKLARHVSEAGASNCAQPCGQATSTRSLASRPDVDLQTQTATTKPPVSHAPYQETGERVEPQTSDKEPRESEQYDILVLSSDEDETERDKFLKMLDQNSWKVATDDDYPIGVTKLKSFSAIFERSTYTALLLTPNFLKNVWCEQHYQTALGQSIENPVKRFSILPIICSKDLKVPMELSILTSVKLFNPNIEKIMKKTINVEKRIMRERKCGPTPTTPKPEARITPTQPAAEPATHPVAARSINELYRLKRPELEPGEITAEVIQKPDVFRKICDCLNDGLPGLTDWRVLAGSFGLTHRSVRVLEEREKNPTGTVLECFFAMERDHGISPSDSLGRLKEILKRMPRQDVLLLLEEM